MKTRQSSQIVSQDRDDVGFPDADSLAALRAWYEGLPARHAVQRYLGRTKMGGQSSRGMLGAIRRRLADRAAQVRRPDLVELFERAGRDRRSLAPRVSSAIEELRILGAPAPMLSDGVALWFSSRVAGALERMGLRTLAELTVRIPRRRMWWSGIPGLGRSGAKQVEALFNGNPTLAARARALIEPKTQSAVVPWERLSLPAALDGSRGMFRAPLRTCTLSARNDYEAICAWLALHEAPSTERAYRKEAERLVLWVTLERGKAMSSMTVEDATAYRSFLRRPTPHARWVGPPTSRRSLQWKPFAGGLSPRSTAYAVSVLSAMFRWLVDQHYLLANPFSGIKVRGGSRGEALDAGRSFSAAEWQLIRTVADGLEWSYGWSRDAARRLRFAIDFSYATGLRAGELVDATLGAIECDAAGDWWLHLVGKGHKKGKVTVPPLARGALDKYLLDRGLPIAPSRWHPDTPLLGRLGGVDPEGGVSQARLWSVVRRFFASTAEVVRESNPALAKKLHEASTHWMRHTHATHALAKGVELTTVRDNLRHASIATTSTYLHGDETKRARQMRDAFGSAP